MSKEDADLDSKSLSVSLGPLLLDGRASLDEIGLDASFLAGLGFEVESDSVRIPEDVERLDEAEIRLGLGERASAWLKDLETLEVVGSTNTLLSELTTAGSIHGVARLAELQVQGRGRRGRGWISPYGQNLALSLGVRIPCTPDKLGGFSLCVGLAVVDVLQALAIDGVELKWPNDVLVHGRKLAGILVEIHGAGSATEVVVGIGVNFRLPEAARAAIDQPVVDLQEIRRGLSRNQVAAGLITSLVDFFEGFARSGFGPMREAFDRLHRFHGKPCWLLMGEERTQGQVRGVTERGELLLEVDGKIQPYSSGEVSLRPI